MGIELQRALEFLFESQSPNGAWKGDYAGPLFLVPVYVAGLYVMGEPIPPEVQNGFVRYLRKHQNNDGGWGLDVESHSHVFTSVLNYIALRILGIDEQDPALQKARGWFLPLGGALSSGSWGKFILCVLNLHDYRGLQPLLPELWLLPTRSPIHPSKLWCHCRMVYLPMSHLYGRRAQTKLNPLLSQIRTEIYPDKYEGIDWMAARNRVAATDAYRPRTALFKWTHRVLSGYERVHSERRRERALSCVLDQIRAEDLATRYLCIGPINKVLNMWVWHFENPGGAEVKAHLARLPEYLQDSEEGMKMNGYNSSELWNTAFAVQAVCGGPADGSNAALQSGLDKAAQYLEANQILQDTEQPARYFRHPSKGGWPFSNRDHGWPISDCTGEGLKASLLLKKQGKNRVPQERLADAVQFILSLQNKDGGWATYELRRGPRWLELLNPSDVFGDIMVDYSYVECTSSCVQGLAAYLQDNPNLPKDERAVIENAIERGAHFILGAQRLDGSWEGSWGVCFTYGTWFAVEGLIASRLPSALASVQRAVEFLVARQRSDGGWSETIESCRRREYVEGAESHAVMTSWALLTLAAAGQKVLPSFASGMSFLKARQRPDGSWPPEPIAGVFNRTSAIHYHAYLMVFPAWALATEVV